jgi:hypothetical protein
MRVMLDRAIGRASSTLSPGHRHFPAQVQTDLPFVAAKVSPCELQLVPASYFHLECVLSISM